MGYDPAGGRSTGCRPGMSNEADFFMRKFQGGSLGCYNPASTLSGGTPSLHADGRAFDLALNAFDDIQRANGDACVFYLIVNHEAFGVQEILWRGFLWSYQNRHLGLRGPGIQQAAHSNHVHIGIDRHTADTWTEAALPGEPLVSTYKEQDMGIAIVTQKNGQYTPEYFWDGNTKKYLPDSAAKQVYKDCGLIPDVNAKPITPAMFDSIPDFRLPPTADEIANKVVAKLPAGQAVDVNALATAIVAEMPKNGTWTAA